MAITLANSECCTTSACSTRRTSESRSSSAVQGLKAAKPSSSLLATLTSPRRYYPWLGSHRPHRWTVAPGYHWSTVGTRQHQSQRRRRAAGALPSWSNIQGAASLQSQAGACSGRKRRGRRATSPILSPQRSIPLDFKRSAVRMHQMSSQSGANARALSMRVGTELQAQRPRRMTNRRVTPTTM